MVSRATSPGPEEVRARGSRRRFPWRTTTRKGITDHAFWHLPRVWVVGREPRNAPRLDAREKNGGNSAGYGKFNEFQQAKIGVEIGPDELRFWAKTQCVFGAFGPESSFRSDFCSDFYSDFGFRAPILILVGRPGPLRECQSAKDLACEKAKRGARPSRLQPPSKKRSSFFRGPLLPETPPYASTGSGLMTSDTSSSRSTPSSST
jgi:hypothetical protein